MGNQPSQSGYNRRMSRSVDRGAQEPRLFIPNGNDIHYLYLADLALRDVKEGYASNHKREVRGSRKIPDAVYKSGGRRPLCYEHHIQMECRDLRWRPGKPTRMRYYACPKRGCSINYSPPHGYSMLNKGAECLARSMTPCVSCPGDGRLMYLAQVKPDARAFRLWRCPQCQGTSTNEEFSGLGSLLQSTQESRLKQSYWGRNLDYHLIS
jgi:hypothetical protein